jgi:hypothetical protein
LLFPRCNRKFAKLQFTLLAQPLRRQRPKPTAAQSKAGKKRKRKKELMVMMIITWLTFQVCKRRKKKKKNYRCNYSQTPLTPPLFLTFVRAAAAAALAYSAAVPFPSSSYPVSSNVLK